MKPNCQYCGCKIGKHVKSCERCGAPNIKPEKPIIQFHPLPNPIQKIPTTPSLGSCETPKLFLCIGTISCLMILFGGISNIIPVFVLGLIGIMVTALGFLLPMPEDTIGWW